MNLRAVPLFLVSHHVKALQLSGAPASTHRSDYSVARNQLGEAFGTKKARAAIRAVERNKIDVGAMGDGVQNVIQNMIQSNTSLLPQKLEAEKSANTHRLIPRFNEQASSPSEVSASHLLASLSYASARFTLLSASFRMRNSKPSRWIKPH